MGVLESGTGPVGLFAGQRWLATGLRLGTELSAEQLSYRTDERIYRVVVRPGGSTVLERARTPATGALVFASIAAAGGLAKVLDSLRVRSTTPARRPSAKGSQRDVDNASRVAFAR